MENLNSNIDNYVRENISLNEDQRNYISDRYNELKNLLIGNEIFQSGSYARGTAIIPINDLDVIWVIPNDVMKKAVDPNNLDPSDILQDLATRMYDEYKKNNKNVRIKAQSHSVGIYFGETDDEFSIDLVPAIDTDEENEYGDKFYLVPQILNLSKKQRIKFYQKSDSGNIEWIKSDPKGYKKEAKAINDKNDNFRKTVKFVKSWRRNCKKNYPDFPFKSFHLELIVNKIFSEDKNMQLWDGILKLYNLLPNYLENLSFPDRANNLTYVDKYINDINYNDKQEIVELINLVLRRIDEIREDESESKILELLGLLISGKDDKEEFIHDDFIIDIDDNCELLIDAIVQEKIHSGSKKSHRITVPEYNLIDKNNKVSIKCNILFSINDNSILPEDLDIKYKWKVKNRGDEAYNAKEGDGDLRGEIKDHPKDEPEETKYIGNHWVECYAIVGKKCIAYARQYVNVTNDITA